MAGKQIKKRKYVHRALPAAAAHRAWLAGLGALAVIQRHGRELLGSLVVEGRDLQSRALRVARESATDVQAQATGIFTPITATVEKRSAQFRSALKRGATRAVNRLGIPTTAQIDDLSRQVAALSRKLKASRQG